MGSKELMRLIENPALLTREHLPELEAMVKEFPYFQPAHLLLSLASRRWDASVYQRSLKRTAIVATSRTRLFNLIQAAEQAPQAEMPVPPSVSDGGKEELDILKAAELTAEAVPLPDAALTAETQKEIVTPEKQNIQIPAEEAESAMEKEIGREVVHALVQTELVGRAAAPETVNPPEAASFGDWLMLLKKNNGQEFRTGLGMDQQRGQPSQEPEPQPTAPPEQGAPAREEARKKKMAIIDSIIEKNPGLIRNREEQKFFAPENKAKESLLENEHLVTETLARIYALQGNTSKAIRAYEILSLKNPQKSAYFASLIHQLKSNQQQDKK